MDRNGTGVFFKRAPALPEGGVVVGQKIIFLDIDGTLTEAGSNDPPQSALQAIARAREEGHFVFLCTGRNYDMLRPLLRYGFDGFIASSGGYIECLGRVIYDCPMTEAQRQSAMGILKKNGIFRTVECRDGTYADESLKAYLRDHAGEAGNSELLRWREQIEEVLNIRPMREYKGQPVYKIVFISPTREQFSEPRKVLEADFAFCMHEENQGGYINGEVVNRKFDKGKAVQRVCRCLNIPACDSVAIGDSMNDREMLEAAGLGICMENGNRELKKIADDICPSVWKDGIRSAFTKHQLIHW